MGNHGIPVSTSNVNNREAELFGEKNLVQKSLSSERPVGEESRRNKGRDRSEDRGAETDRPAGVGFLGGAHILAERSQGLARWEEVAGLTCSPIPQK